MSNIDNDIATYKELISVIPDKYFETPIRKLNIPNKYDRLIDKIELINRGSTKEILIPETYQGIMYIENKTISKIMLISLEYVKLLNNLKCKLPLYLELYFLKSLDKKPRELQDYELDIPITSIALPSYYIKLIKKIYRYTDRFEYKLSNTVGDIVCLNLAEFIGIRSVGKSYITLLQNLINEVSIYVDLSIGNFKENIKLENNYSNKEYNKLRLTKKHPEEKLKLLYINKHFLDVNEKKFLSKLCIHFGANDRADKLMFILNINKSQLLNTQGFGELSIKALASIQRKLNVALDEISENDYQLDLRKKGLIQTSEIRIIDLKYIDNILIDDIEDFLWALDERQRDIAMSQWGFNWPYNTLEKLGEKHKYTRERIRQISIGINIDLVNSLRLNAKVLWANFRENLSSDIPRLMPNLVKCFGNIELFYSFIEICCQLPKGSIKEIVLPEFKANILNEFFSQTASPISYEETIEELISSYSYSKAQAANIIQILKKNKKIEVVDNKIVPRQLGKKEAIAHILAGHPTGLPWKDICRIINISGCSLHEIDDSRVDQAFNSSNLVYLSATGTYRHIMFLNIDNIDIKTVIENITSHLESNQLQNMHLHNYYYQTQENCGINNYFTLRHVVREFAEEYGLYFDGKSGVDSISLTENDERITQSKVIIRTLAKANGTMTKQEIAELLRSKSLDHASYYLNNLINDGKIVRIDRMMYTTPENAFKNVNKIEILKAVKDIMYSSKLPVDADIFRENINLKLNLSYSKYFYAALVKTELKNLKWDNKYTLFSTGTISFNSLYDIANQHCDLSLSNEDNVEIIQKFVKTTKASTLRVINNLKLKKQCC